MKKYFITAALILICIGNTVAQINLNNPNLDAIMLNQGNGKIFRNPKNQSEKILGTPYFNPMFASAKVDNVASKANMRYNAHRDEFEFINSKNDTLVLDKINDFGTITFVGSNKKYKLLTYSSNIEKSHQGYLIEIYEKSSYALYKRERISLYEGKKAKTSLEVDMPPKFNKEHDTFFLRHSNGNITEFPESKKQLAKLFPDKKEAIETFVKENKIDFSNQADLIKVIDFLAAL